MLSIERNIRWFHLRGNYQPVGRARLARPTQPISQHAPRLGHQEDFPPEFLGQLEDLANEIEAKIWEYCVAIAQLISASNVDEGPHIDRLAERIKAAVDLVHALHCDAFEDITPPAA